MTAVKAVADEMNRMESALEKAGFAFFYYPVVVLRGDLFEAVLGKDGKMAVKSSKHVRVEVDYLAPGKTFNYVDMRYIVDVLHEDSLPAYLDIVESSRRLLFERVQTLLTSPS